MNFEEQLKALSARTDVIIQGVNTEEATKTSLIMPFFQILGYDIFNPLEFIPEFTADVGIKKGEKVDYAISLDNEPVILIEAKSVKEELQKHDSQLFRYFGTTKSKFAILTNGVNYKFFTDLESPNVMDNSPFLEFDMRDLREHQISEIKKFHKENFDINKIIDTASELKFTGLMRNVLKEQFNNPSDDFVKFVLNNGVFDGVKTQNIIDKFKPLVKKSISLYINETVNDKIKNALKDTDSDMLSVQISDDITDVDLVEDSNRIVTTEQEMESFYIVKSIIRDSIDSSRITYKDTASYFGILIDGKTTKWLCRIALKENVKFVNIPNEDKSVARYDIDSIDDIYNLKEALLTRLDALK